MKKLISATAVLVLCLFAGTSFAGTQSLCPSQIINYEAAGPDLEGWENLCDGFTGSGVVEVLMEQPANTPSGLQTIKITMKRTSAAYNDTYFQVCDGQCWGFNAYDADAAALTTSYVTYTLTFPSSAMTGDPSGANTVVSIFSAEAWDVASIEWVSTY